MKNIANYSENTATWSPPGTESTPLLDVRGLVRDYPLPRERPWGPAPRLRALDGVDLALAAGRSLGVVGESGSGKSTLARLVMALDTPTAGTVHLRGRDLHALDPAGLRAARRDFQMVFQDPYGSLDPRLTVERIVAEPLAALERLPRPAQRERVAEVLAQVGLRPGDAGKYPHEFSGGQRQRIAIARAIVTRPALVVADEPVSALDVSVQAQVLNLLRDLREQAGISYLLISHDLAVVRHLCDEVVVLRQGRIVERGAPDALFRAPAHPYTRELVAAVPRAVPRAGRPSAAG
ncbi:ATP-binding cassette domain-containing protein [Acidovorax sp. NCPPB 2350]|nr:ATP-binding cassette domain-containing protein [Acidovorax sp. NCPPB 2350]